MKSAGLLFSLGVQPFVYSSIRPFVFPFFSFSPFFLFSLLLCALFTLAPTTRSSAQETDHTTADLVDPEDGMTDLADLDRLEALRHAPLDLNRAGRAELEQLPWLTPQQAAAIVIYREQYGSFTRIQALRRIPGLDDQTINRILPFVHIKLPGPFVKGRWRMFYDGKAQTPSDETIWSGLQSELSIGRRMTWGARVNQQSSERGVQWRSGYFELRDITGIDRIVAGHFDLQFGQGLILGNRSIRRVDGLSGAVKWRGREIAPARTSGQSGPYFGVAMQGGVGRLQSMAAWAEYRTGEQIQSGRLAWSSSYTIVGVTTAAVTADSGSRRTIRSLRSGLDMDVMIGAANVFGEVAVGAYGGMGMVSGMQWASGRFDGGVVFSHISTAFGRQRFTSGSATRPHTRWATRIRYRPDSRTILLFAYDTVRPPRLRDGSSTTNPVNMMSIRLRRRFSHAWTMSGWWRHDRPDREAGIRRYTHLRQGQIDWAINRRLRLRTRGSAQLLSLDGGPRNRTYRFLGDLRYRAEGGITISGQWSATYGAASEWVEDIFEEETAYRHRWAAFVRSPVIDIMDISIRYAYVRSARTGASRLPARDVTWSVQARVSL